MRFSHLSEASHVLHENLRSINVHTDERYTGKFQVVSAHLSNYLPDIPLQEHEPIFRDILLHQQLSLLEQSAPEAFKQLRYEGLQQEHLLLLKNHPCVICTFHTGSYRLINLFLAINKIAYSLVISGHVIQQQGNVFRRAYELVSDPGDDGFRIIDAEQPSGMLRMLRDIQQGRSILLYIDGNSGAGDRQDDHRQYCKVHFLAQMLMARKGVAYLSYMASAPIVTIGCSRSEQGSNSLRFFPVIYPDKGEERGCFSQRVTQQLYNWLAEIVRDYPGQWEAWLYLYKSVCICDTHTSRGTGKKEGKQFVLNARLYSVFSVAGHAFLFNRITYDSYPIDNTLLQLLQQSTQHAIQLHTLDNALFKQLFENDVLVCA